MHINNSQFESILDGCRLNHRKSQKDLYVQYFGFGMSIALRYANNYEDAVEMVNDSFLKIYKDVKNFIPKFESISNSFTAWIKIIFIHSCIDHIRKYEKKNKLVQFDQKKIDVIDKQESGEDVLQYKEVLKCIQQLSPIHKTVFNLFVIDGLSHNEIAEQLEIPVNTSKSYLFKAKKQLQELLKKTNIKVYERAV